MSGAQGLRIPERFWGLQCMQTGDPRHSPKDVMNPWGLRDPRRYVGHLDVFRRSLEPRNPKRLRGVLCGGSQLGRG